MQAPADQTGRTHTDTASGGAFGCSDVDSAQRLPGQEMAIEQEWFVESGDSYAGPISAIALEQMWRRSEIHENSLVWAPEMVDWQALAETSELVYLLTECPQEIPPVSFSDQQWRLSPAQRNLGDLARQELEGIPDSSPRPLPPEPTPAPAGLPNIRALGFIDDPGQTHPTGESAKSTATDGCWTLPRSWPWKRRRRDRWWLHALSGAVLVFGTTMLGVAVKLVTARPQPPFAATLGSVAPIGPQQVVLSSKQEASASPDLAATQGEAKQAPVVRTRPPRLERRSIRPTPKPSTQTRRPTPTASQPVPPVMMTRERLLSQVRGQYENLAPCIKQARAAGELTPQRYRFVLDWVIGTNGRVASPRLRGPSSVLQGSLSQCFATKMRAWSFTPVPKAIPVSRFPVVVNVR